MAIIHTLEKRLDEFILEVEQITKYELYYISDNSNKLVSSATIGAGIPFTLITDKDGTYRLTLIVENETDVNEEFNVIKFLQNSIINDTQNILCNTCNGGSFTSSTCITKEGENCLKNKSIFVKLLTFQTLYIPTYNESYSIIFTEYLEDGAILYKCNLQTTINDILLQECVTGNVVSTDKLFKLFVALYWSGMYFIEKALAGTDEEQLAFIKQKFKYDTIVPCLCDLCIDIQELEDNFGNVALEETITSFQFNGAQYTIADVDLLTPEFLGLYGQVHTEEEMLIGKDIQFVTVGRIGFVLKGVTPNEYIIKDVFGNDITTIVFDRVYDGGTLTETFVSKEHYTPSTFKFQFVKN